MSSGTQWNWTSLTGRLARPFDDPQIASFFGQIADRVGRGVALHGPHHEVQTAADHFHRDLSKGSSVIASELGARGADVSANGHAPPASGCSIPARTTHSRVSRCTTRTHSATPPMGRHSKPRTSPTMTGKVNTRARRPSAWNRLTCIRMAGRTISVRHSTTASAGGALVGR